MNKTLLLILLSLSACAPLFKSDRSPSETERYSYKQVAYRHGARAHFGGGLTLDEKIREYVKNLNNQDPVVRIHAASYLGELGGKAKSAVGPLIAKLKDPHYWVRRSVAKSLGNIGSRKAVQPLRRALSDSDPYVANSAANALRKINSRQVRRAPRR